MSEPASQVGRSSEDGPGWCSYRCAPDMYYVCLDGTDGDAGRAVVALTGQDAHLWSVEWLGTDDFWLIRDAVKVTTW